MEIRISNGRSWASEPVTVDLASDASCREALAVLIEAAQAKFPDGYEQQIQHRDADEQWLTCSGWAVLASSGENRFERRGVYGQEHPFIVRADETGVELLRWAVPTPGYQPSARLADVPRIDPHAWKRRLNEIANECHPTRPTYAGGPSDTRLAELATEYAGILRANRPDQTDNQWYAWESHTRERSGGRFADAVLAAAGRESLGAVGSPWIDYAPGINTDYSPVAQEQR